MVADQKPWTLTIPSDLRLVTLVRDFVEAFAQVAGQPREVIDAIVLATHEGVNNVIRHAHQHRPEAQVQIHCFVGPDRIEVRLLDEGEPFDVNAVTSLDPAEVRVGGRGVFLMRSLVDELTCRPRAERGNTMCLVKRCGQNTSAQRAG